MLRLLNIEFHKLKHNKASKVLSIIYFGLLTSIALIAAIKFDIGPVKFHLAEQGIFNFLTSGISTRLLLPSLSSFYYW